MKCYPQVPSLLLPLQHPSPIKGQSDSPTDLLATGQKPAAKTPALRLNVTDKAIVALTSPDVLNKIVLFLTDEITETITSVIETSIQSYVDSHIKPLIETINKPQQTIAEQEGKIIVQTNKLAEQSDTISKLEHKTI
jgi:hypothetical protein